MSSHINLDPPSSSTVKKRSSSNIKGMASATGISAQDVGVHEGAREEDEPLLGRAGDASQQAGGPMFKNLFIGTAVIAQAGIWIFTAVVWGSILTATPLMLFHAHPLLNSAGILLVTQAILVLQPTHTQSQKITGTYWHSALNNLGLAALIAGLIVIEYNKGLDPAAHWHSVHAYLGVVTYCILAVQSLVGATAFFLPGVYGGVGKAKSLYKYHRMSGYALLVLMFVTVAFATRTPFNQSTLHVKLWAVVVSAVITMIGIIPRIKKRKLGL